MGRQIRRVPLDFDWPLNEVWHGFLNPLYAAEPCSLCEGSGSSPTARHLSAQWYGHVPFRPEDRGSTPFSADHYVIRSRAERNIPAGVHESLREYLVSAEAERLSALFNSSWCHHLNQDDVDALVEADRLWDLTREFRPGEGWVAPAVPPRLTPEEVNEWSISGFGHDSINQWVVVKAECERLGVSSRCALCEGEGELWPSEDAKSAYETWQETPPPEGEGWQCWETVSEGSPVTPVFATADELVWHLVIHEGYAEDAARAFVNHGSAPSMVMDDKGVRSGIAALPDILPEE